MTLLLRLQVSVRAKTYGNFSLILGHFDISITNYTRQLRCKFNPCKFNHITNNLREIDIEQFREDNLKTVAKLNDIEKILDEKKDLEAKINICDEKLKVFETKISEIELKMVQKDEEISEILKKKENSERNLQMKKNILERLEVIDKLNEEKDIRIKNLEHKVEKLENS